MRNFDGNNNQCALETSGCGEQKVHANCVVYYLTVQQALDIIHVSPVGRCMGIRSGGEFKIDRNDIDNGIKFFFFRVTEKGSSASATSISDVPGPALDGHGQSPPRPVCLAVFTSTKFSGVSQHTHFSLHRTIISACCISKNGCK